MMTDQKEARAKAARAAEERKSVRRRTISTVLALAVSLSIALFGGLSLQMAEGNDPVLGKEGPEIIKKKVVVVKKVMLPRKTVYVPAEGSSTYSASSSPAYPSSTTYTAPAPAPTPAPVVSSPS